MRLVNKEDGNNPTDPLSNIKKAANAAFLLCFFYTANYGVTGVTVKVVAAGSGPNTVN